MAIYNISAEIKTNTAPENLYYEMELYKTDWNGNKTYALRPTGQHPVKAESIDTEKRQMHPSKDNLGQPVKQTSSQTIYKTQLHASLDIADPQEACYILAIDIYRKVGANFHKMTQDPMTAITPLKGFLTNDKDWGVSREFEYYETKQQTQKSQQGQINTFQLTISSKPRVFEAKEHPIGEPLDPFTKQNVEDELKIRMTRPIPSQYPSLNARLTHYYPFQGASSCCGPASFFYSLLEDRPDIYQQVIKELWETGNTKIGSLKISPSDDCKHPSKFFDGTAKKLPAIDWISLASLRDSENSFFDYQSPNNEFSGITMDGNIKSWFHKMGSSCLYSTRFSLILDYLLGTNLNLKEVCLLNSYISTSNHVMTLIGDRMISKRGVSRKVHWIVWRDKLRLKKDNSEVINTTPLSEIVTLKLFSWGDEMELVESFTLKEVLKFLYGGLVFTKIP